MLIGISGGICAGKHAVQDYLINEHGFQPLSLEGSPRPNDAVPSNAKPALFTTASILLDHATANWRTNFVTTSVTTLQVAETLAQRPHFLLLHIDAPLLLRHARHTTHALQPPLSLETFAAKSDAQLPALTSLATRAQLTLLNTTPSLAHLHATLRALNLPDPARLRPSWDHYFMRLAGLAARRSNCMRRAVGCVLVRGGRVISTGYNGTPRHVTNCSEGGCPRCNGAAGATGGGAALSTCLCIHAEENALLEAGRERVGGVGEAVLYCNTCPCLTCSVKIVQVGIAEVVYSQSYWMDAEAAKLFEEEGVRLRQFEAPREGVVVMGVEGGEFEGTLEV